MKTCMTLISKFSLFRFFFLSLYLTGVQHSLASQDCRVFYSSGSYLIAPAHMIDGIPHEFADGDWKPVTRPLYASPQIPRVDPTLWVPQSNIPDLRPLKLFPSEVHRIEGDRFYENSGNNFPSSIHIIQAGNHRIEIIIPKGSGYEDSADKLIQLILGLPKNRIESINAVRLNTRVSTKYSTPPLTPRSIKRSSA